MKTKITLFVLGLAVVIGLAAVMLGNRPTAKETARIATPEPAKNSTPAFVTPAPAPDPSPAEPAGNLSDSAPPPQTAEKDAAPKVAPKATPAKKPKEPLHDPDARAAMSLVGADPVAEAYWLEAIFDSSLPDQEREDLIEDLNEEGLSDHRRPGPDDFPLIMNRIVIIEQIAPHADEFMLPHLGEVYKDLWNLAEIAQGGGEPVR